MINTIPGLRLNTVKKLALGVGTLHDILSDFYPFS